MTPGYTPAQRRDLAAAVHHGAPLRCPACGAPLVQRDVPHPPDVAYVRRRVWLLCPACKRTATVNLAPETGGR